MTRSGWKRMTSVLVVLLLATSLAWTQATTSVRGTVTDPDGKAVAGASVVLSNAESRTERSVTTGNQSSMRAPRISLTQTTPITPDTAATTTGYQRP